MDTQVKARLPDGHVTNLECNADDTLRVLHVMLQSHVGDDKFFLATSYPKRTFADNELDNYTVKQAGLHPRGMVVCQTSLGAVQQGAGALLTPGVIHVHGQAQYSKWKSTPGHLVVVDFSAVWCPPCQQIKPVFEELAKKYGKDVVFLHVDVDDNKDCEDIGDVSGVPTFKFFKNKALLNKFSGADARKLEQLITQYK